MLSERHALWCFSLLGAAVILLMMGGVGSAEEREVTITGKEVVERLTRLEEGQKRLEAQLGQRIDGVEARLGQVEARLGQRIDETNRRIDELRGFLLWGFGMTFAGMFTLVGFVIWDRRTALAPAVRRIEDLQERERRIEEALKLLSRDDPKLAEILRSLGLL